MKTTIAQSEQETGELRDRFGVLQSEISTLESKTVELTGGLKQLQTDKEAFQVDIIASGQKLIDQETTYKKQKALFDKQLESIQLQLIKAINKLVKTEAEDKKLRAAWKEEAAIMERRTQSLQKMERRLAGAEARIKELNSVI